MAHRLARGGHVHLLLIARHALVVNAVEGHLIQVQRLENVIAVLLQLKTSGYMGLSKEKLVTFAISNLKNGLLIERHFDRKSIKAAVVGFRLHE
jgi:hypothetical protein